MKKVVKYCMLLCLLLTPIIVRADSGLDSNYEPSKSLVEAGISAGSSGLSFVGDLFTIKPGSEDYIKLHMIISIICLVIIYIVTCVYLYKILNKEKNFKNTLFLLAISIIPTLIMSLVYFLTTIQLIFYITVLVIYIIIFSIISKIISKKRLNKQLLKLKNLDKKFSEDNFNKEAFDIYKEIQYAWMNNDLNKLKNLVSDEIYNKYREKLDELNSKNRKNIMDKIEFKSNKIIDIKINNSIYITCEMKVTCIDYIIENDEKIVKGKKDKIYNYSYKLSFNKDIKNNKLILVQKKINKIEV